MGPHYDVPSPTPPTFWRNIARLVCLAALIVACICAVFGAGRSATYALWAATIAAIGWAILAWRLRWPVPTIEEAEVETPPAPGSWPDHTYPVTPPY